MIKNITYFAPHKTALTVSLVVALSSLLMIIPMAISFSFMPSADPQGNPVDKSPFLFMVIGMPFLYFIFGYLFTGLLRGYTTKSRRLLVELNMRHLI